MRQTLNRLEIKGLLTEKNLKEEKGTVGANKTPCNIIKGSVVVESNGNFFKIKVYKASKTSKGEENKNYELLKTFLKESKAKMTVNGETKVSLTEGETPSYVSIEVEINENSYVNKENKLVNIMDYAIPYFKSFKIIDEEELCEGKIEGVISKIVNEVKDENETGRLNIEMYTVGYNDKSNLLKFIVPEDLAEDFEEIYEVGDTVKLDYACVSVGQTVTKAKRAFGRSAKIVEGYAFTEYQIIGGEEPYDEEEMGKDGIPLKFSKKEIKEIKENRDIYMEQLEKEGYKGNATSEKPKAKKKTSKENPFKKEKVAEEVESYDVEDFEDDDDDLPF